MSARVTADSEFTPEDTVLQVAEEFIETDKIMCQVKMLRKIKHAKIGKGDNYFIKKNTYNLVHILKFLNLIKKTLRSQKSNNFKTV